MPNLQTYPKSIPFSSVALADRDNLVLIHSFPTNSILLGGLIDYLDDHYNVYFIDLPGFTQNVSPLENISLDAYADFVEERLVELNLDSYVLGGISFGFAVANKVKVNSSSCKSIIAIEPYINQEYLKLGFLRRYLYSHLIGTIANNESLIEKIWDYKFADEILAVLTGQPFERMETIFKEIDGETFFKTALQLIKNNELPSFNKDVPYILVINEDDKTVNASGIVSLFSKNVPLDNLLVVYTNIDHYPKDLSKKYFEERLPVPTLEEIRRWTELRNADL